MKLDNTRVLEKIREYFQDPEGFPDLPDYIVALWRLEPTDDFKTAERLEPRQHGQIYRTTNIQELQELYFVLRKAKDVRLYQITPQRIAFLLEYLGANV